jgi:hypothetical protein
MAEERSSVASFFVTCCISVHVISGHQVARVLFETEEIVPTMEILLVGTQYTTLGVESDIEKRVRKMATAIVARDGTQLTGWTLAEGFIYTVYKPTIIAVLPVDSEDGMLVIEYEDSDVIITSKEFFARKSDGGIKAGKELPALRPAGEIYGWKDGVFLRRDLPAILETE